MVDLYNYKYLLSKLSTSLNFYIKISIYKKCIAQRNLCYWYDG